LFKKIHSELASIVSDFFPPKNYVVYSAKEKGGIFKLFFPSGDLTNFAKILKLIIHLIFSIKNLK
jgi:hypothetical protein